jgi:hypothetical protein
VNGSGPGTWIDKLSKASLTLLLAAVGLSIAWQLLQRLLPALIVLAGLVFVYKLALGWFRRDGW